MWNAIFHRANTPNNWNIRNVFVNKTFRTKASTKVCVCLLTFIICSLYCMYTSSTQPILYKYKLNKSNSTCILPDPDPFDSSIKHLLSHPDPIACHGGPEFVILDENGFLKINSTVVVESHFKDVRCEYQHFIRKGPTQLDLGSKHVLVSPTYIDGDVFLVTCEDNKNTKIYERVHYNINFKRTLRSRKLKNESDDDLSVLIITLDSVSRLAAERHLPKTMQFMTSQLGAFVFKGHSINNEWSTANAVALMKGKLEFPSKYWNNVSLIWDEFQRRGYVTSYSEDYVDNATFKPFILPPTDHFMQPFYLAIQTLEPFGFYLNYARMFLEDKQKAFKFKNSSPLCYGSIPRHRHMLEFYRRFVHAYKGKLKFGLSWFDELAHDFSSYLELADEDFLEFFKWLFREGHLKNTMLIFMGDHGSRVGAVRNTKIGRMEFKMPLLSIVLPDSFKQRYPHIVENLNENKLLLTSHFDIYETMQDVINKRFNVSFTHTETGVKTIGSSLFRKLPLNRNCEEIGIPENFCPCYVSQVHNKDDHISGEIADFVVQEINKVLKPVANHCVIYELASIDDIQRIMPKFQEIIVKANSFNSFLHSSSVQEDDRYSIVIKTSPGDAIFEALVSKTQEGYTLIGRITRSSKYGKTSECMTDKYLRELCLCRKFVNLNN